MNKVIVLGRLTKDPEIRATPTGHTVCNFSLAVNRNYTRGEERPVDFFNIVTWNKTADFCKNYFSKGQQVCLVGRLQTRNWDDAEGKRHYATEIVADEVYFADKRRDSGSEYGSRPAATMPGMPAEPAEPAGLTGSSEPTEMPVPPAMDDNKDVMDFLESDDIPF